MIIVTGGAGFIGSNIVAALEARQKERIVICDRLRDGVKWRNVAKRELADIVHPDDLDGFLQANARGISAIFHMGAISSTTESDADKIIANNFKLTLRLWTWCIANNVRFIYASSAATYGDGAQGFVDDYSPEFLARLRPMNPYGWSKNLFDRRASRALQAGEPRPPQWVGLKFFNVYGPNEYHKGSMQSVVSHVYPRAKAGEPAALFRSHHPDFEDGGQLRDFIYVKDCIDVMMWFLDNPQISGIFNCGTGKARSFKELAGAVYRALDKEPLIKYVPTPEHIRDKYQYYTQADMTRLREAGYDREFCSLEQGVREYVIGFLDAEDPFL